ncbi:hypothetical protein BBJ29_003669 [Phytophthora kernoviae]|uniref:Phosphodiesterase n=1 Tax=Phytophthora kernoviae TaxID=325452 RepID=A0A3F2RL27_9STRA|nr:hypothetical protein BBP00_00006414 [Phytophthora kernoviae]RLN70391.1 hypothetical protein BBJ29_003669 [Phytophthora kernoviae]
MANGDEIELLCVPLQELKAAMHGARVALEENRRLAEELARSEDEARALELKLVKRQHQLDCCADVRSDSPRTLQRNRLNSIGTLKRLRPKSELFGASMRNLIGEQAQTLNQLTEREESLHALMDAMREISQASNSLDIVSSALRAAQHVFPAEKYTLGILNEKKDRVDLYSNPPIDLPGHRYLTEDGMQTGTPLEVADVGGSEIMDVFDEQMELLEFELEALLCSPIFNVHGVLVGVFQVITRKQPPELGRTPPTPIEEPPWFSNSPRATLAKLSRNQESRQKGAFEPRDKESFDYICVATGTALWNLSLARAHQFMQGRIECLLKLNRNIAAEVSASAVLHQIIAVSYELLHSEHIALYVRDEGTDEFYLFVSEGRGDKLTATSTGTKSRTKFEDMTGEKPRHLYGRQRERYDQAYLKAHNGIVGLVMRSGQLVLANSARSHPAFDPKFDDVFASVHTKQVLCAPVKNADGYVLAVVCATNKVDGDDFTADDALYLNYAAEAAGISLHKSNLLRSVLMSQRLTEARLQLADYVSSSSGRACNGDSTGDENGAAASIARFVRVVMVEGRKLLHCDRFGFLLVDPLKKELWIAQEDGESLRIPLTSGLSGLVATTGKTLVTRDAYLHPHFDPTMDQKTGYRTTTVLGMPIFEDHTPTNPKIVAVVMAINKKDDDDDGNDDDSHSDSTPAARSCVSFTASDVDIMTQYCREVGQETFSTFLSHVASHYRPNAFHNIQHAFQVTHATYCLLRRSGVAHSYFARVEIFSILVAALCHDLDHPGNTNDFEVKAHSQLALTHNDDAVLERHHCRVAFIILSHPGANLLARLPSRACFVYVRRLLIHCILATDMAKHFEKCKALEGLSKRHLLISRNEARRTKRSRSKHRFVFMAILIHAADLSGQALPYPQAVRWGTRVLSEFQEQAKNEAEMHVPVESFMTNLHHAKTRVTVQLNFINYVLRPIWLPLATLCPAVRVYADALESNRERYKVELDKLHRETTEMAELADSYVRDASSRNLLNKHA